jgi:hypothetical protein
VTLDRAETLFLLVAFVAIGFIIGAAKPEIAETILTMIGIAS